MTSLNATPVTAARTAAAAVNFGAAFAVVGNTGNGIIAA